ncbi:MAG: TldD/PmbA family protein [Nanoarchaeota archaeon]|nr:TldD/PmbA family protein [Nanoarchaeota archaeon]MBU1445502.1 TldD/PmbA family protein [Nanoarchaeota archaeon]MBU2406417.1 TldD/PmbA family protein [Nanoarchaeota archaeon]MBU2420686.1 TldD/PmbA family protein [Nanoarchaeota archaeon]MBU2475673.1 TldD/PmbA family protein [Nanoarchaeota archaeon]
MNIEKYLLKKLEKEMDQTIISSSKGNSTSIKFVNNKVVNISLNDSHSIGIFVAKNKKIVSTSLKNLNQKSVDLTIKTIKSYIKKIPPNEEFIDIAKGPFKYKEIKQTFDKKLENLNHLDLIEEAINSSNAKRSSGTFATSSGENLLLTSHNIESQEKGTGIYFSIRALMTKEASGQKTVTSRILNKKDILNASKKAGEIAKQALNPINGKSGTFDVVFDSLPFACLVNPIGTALSIFSVEAGSSFFHDKINQNVGNFTLIDDSTLPNGYNSSKCDLEGTPGKRSMLVDKGILKTYLHNTSSSKRYNVENTGNAGIIIPSPSNLIFETKKGNVFGTDKGIYITNLWYTRFQNTSTGDFSTIPRDGIFLIKNGKLDKPIKNIRISDNMLKMLKNVVCSSKKPEQITSWEAETPVITPSVLIKDVKITKPTV